MGFFRNFYRYVIRENWLVLTGEKAQAKMEADAWALSDVDGAMTAARERIPYRRYHGEVDEWRERFDATVSKMEKGDPQRRMAYGSDELAALPEVPEFDRSIFGFPQERLMHHAVMLKLQEETRAWREDRLRRARERLGLP